MIKIDNQNDKDSLKITLVEGIASDGYDKGASFESNGEGYIVFVDRKKSFPFRKVGRVVSSLGAKNITLSSNFKLESENLLALLTSLDDLDDKEISVHLVNQSEEKVNELNLDCTLIGVCRRISDLSGSQLRPKELGDLLFKLINNSHRPLGSQLSFRIIDKDSKDYAKLTGIKALSQGASQGCMAIVDYLPKGLDGDSPIDLALIGKGITFDSGGYDIKPESFMESMRTDKCGAVTAAGIFSYLIRTEKEHHLRLYLCCAENLISEHSILPGDILTYPNGITVEIGNTDAEGRLVLADGICQAVESQARTIITLATLTGSAKIAFGRDMPVLVNRENYLPKRLVTCFDFCEQYIWNLPLFEFHDRFINSKRADINNDSHGDSAPGVMTAAAFLSKFIPDGFEFLHFDLSSAYLPSSTPYYAKGPTGSAILPLGLWLANFYNRKSSALKITGSLKD